MEFLFDSHGSHIANFVNGQLYAPSGQNIGHFLAEQKIFIDMHGQYLGEIVLKNRLLRQDYSPYQNTSFGNFGDYGNVGNYGNPGNHGSIGMIGGFSDVAPQKLKP